ncbi:MAG: LysM peptidoglycan-binding domain-containing protein [Geobacter sp.]|nr:LysM peptidoglycan-binding domain-containing protein [Geobacter sp.]
MRQQIRLSAVAALLCSIALPAWSQQEYLYEPKPVAADSKTDSGDGVLVREVPVKKGDTLYDISKKFSGHGIYYPQILLFNDIKNPDLIYTGDTLRIPLPKEGATESATPAKHKHSKKSKHSSRPPKKVSSKTVGRSLKAHSNVTTARKSSDTLTELSLSELKRMENKKGKPGANNSKSAGVSRKKVVEADSQPVNKQGEATTGNNVETLNSRPISIAAIPGQKLFDNAVKSYKQNDYRAALELFDKFLTENPNSPIAADASLYKAECYLKLSTK